ncbi:MAG: nuclear transport factor 2 family protein [Novosphingobium sp.]|nr:nuclear transport factor 2 family protein [Novosphingobium sp.]
MNGAESGNIAPERLARLGELLDRQDIFDCIKRVSRGIDRFDRELFLSAYHDDALIDAGTFVESAQKVCDGGMALHDQGQTATIHHLTNHTCDLDGDTAHTETYFLYVGNNRDGTVWAAGGRYADRLERREGEWKIAFRYTIIEWSGKVDPVEVPLAQNVPDIHGNGVPSRSREDPTYRRPLTNLRELHFPDNPGELGTLAD